MTSTPPFQATGTTTVATTALSTPTSSSQLSADETCDLIWKVGSAKEPSATFLADLRNLRQLSRSAVPELIAPAAALTTRVDATTTTNGTLDLNELRTDAVFLDNFIPLLDWHRSNCNENRSSR